MDYIISKTLQGTRKTTQSDIYKESKTLQGTTKTTN